MTEATPEHVLERTWEFCTSRAWSGKDPYDGLMVHRFPVTLLTRFRAGRLALIQGMKHSPVDFRGLLGVPPLLNPKAMALGLESSTRLTSVPEWRDRGYAEAVPLVERLLGSITPTPNGHGWGYPFDWQSRVFFLAHGVPTVVCSGFVVRALDGARALLADDDPLAGRVEESLRAAARFVLHDLNRSEDGDGFCWSYSPLDESRVVNATLLGAETVARAAALDGDRAMLDEIRGTIRWTLARRREDGSWSYGGASVQRWEDAFHTGFNLISYLAIRDAAARCGADPDDYVPEELVLGSYRHFRDAFFDDDGRPWYYRHTPWPIDAHAAAVAILTHLAFDGRVEGARERARRTLEWTIENMWLNRGWFRFQIKRWYRIDIPYLRWCQAWMLRALAEWRAVDAAA